MRWILILISLTLSSQLQAAQMVLIQGYLSTSQIWQQSGIAKVLQQHDWQPGGTLYKNSSGVVLMPPADAKATDKLYYQVELPYEASIRQQGWVLNAYLQYLQKLHPDEPLILVGHSAGGVVARYVMVQQPDLKVDKLITFSSPNLGTQSATVGTVIGNSPLAMFTPMIGAQTLNRSQALYRDLVPEKSGNFLYWLNRQNHPKADYISFTHEVEGNVGGDLIVSAHSQDLRNVAALGQRAQNFSVSGGHGLSRTDGERLMQVLEPTPDSEGSI